MTDNKVIIKFSEKNYNGNHDDIDVLVMTTWPKHCNIGVGDVEEFIKEEKERLTSNCEYFDTDELVDKTCDWMKRFGITSESIIWYDVDF